MIFLSPGDVEGETSEKLESDDLLYKNVMLLEAKTVPKRPERRQRGREAAKREQRSATSALKSVLGALGTSKT